ncbi:ammonium transporter AmtB-like domain-containing protein [Pavlovales sp. CCMP2436]|nr:ammonium transporter AmtB-like domain-containing protein [Pavlovales sp. CCMP2436]
MGYSAEALEFAAHGDTWYLIWAGTLVFFMQCGFAMVEAGCVRSKNTKNILLKNILDACIGALVWWLVGYGVAFGGPNDGPFIGVVATGSTESYLMIQQDWAADYEGNGHEYASWFFQFTFAATSATIVSGGVAERCSLSAYLIYSVCLTGLVYPVIVHMLWDAEGVLSAYNHGSPGGVLGGVIDFAGSGVVHLVGGIAAFVGAIFLGPRIGRFDENGKVVAMPGHSSVLQVLGTFFLWLGWYGFNGGSTLAVFTLDAQYARDMARIEVISTLGASAGAISAVLFTYFTTHVWDLSSACNGVLCGLVSVTASCAVIEPWAAIIIGGIGGIIMLLTSKLVLKLKIDDPLDAFAVHAGGGMWALIATGIFCKPEYTYNTLGSHGFVYPGDKPDLMAVQVTAVVLIWAWVGGCSTIIFGSLKLLGIFRVPAAIEEAGMDVSKHGGDAYDIH